MNEKLFQFTSSVGPTATTFAFSVSFSVSFLFRSISLAFAVVFCVNVERIKGARQQSFFFRSFFIYAPATGLWLANCIIMLIIVAALFALNTIQLSSSHDV